MKILVVGGGGREHAIIKSLKKSPRVTEIFAAPGNGGIAADAICTGIGAKDLDAITAFAKDNAIDFAVVAPDDPLVLVPQSIASCKVENVSNAGRVVSAVS